MMSRSYIEAFFRHRYLLMLPPILGFVVGASMALMVPRAYVAYSSVWVDTRVPEATTVGTTGGDSPPSAGQATLLTQWLGTREFMRSVILRSPMASQYQDADPLSREYFASELASQLSVATPGPQVLSVSAKLTDQEDAIGLVTAVMDQFNDEQVALMTARAKKQNEYDAKQLQKAEQVLAVTQGNLDTFTATGGVGTTPAGASLAAAAQLAQSQYAEAALAFNTSSLDLEAATTGLQVLDTPDVAIPQARKKTVVFGAAAGLLAGLTVSIMALIFIMARDRSVRSEPEAADALGFAVVGSIPEVGVGRRRTVQTVDHSLPGDLAED